MIWLVYNVLFAVGYTLLLPKFLLRMRRRGGYREGFLQRFGCYNDTTASKLAARRRIWVHAVSVGEVFVALHYMRELREYFPGVGFVLTTTTSTGYTQARDRLSDDDVLLYFPADFPMIVKRVVRRLNPVAVLLTECELWPNLLRCLNRRGVPVFVINGRISAASFRGYSKVRPFVRRAVAWVDRFFVQADIDRDRLLALGASDDRIEVTGSAKYDVAQPDADGATAARRILRDAGMDPDGELLVGGSTWPGEERVLLDIFHHLRESYPALQMILVPRHMERRDAVEGLLKQSGLPYRKRTDMDGARPSEDGAVCVLLADTTGELKHYYAVASLVFVGKSLGDNHGGQNPIEPAMAGKPIIVGPNMENFPGVMQDFLGADALIQVSDRNELEAQLDRLLGDEAARRTYGDRATALVADKRGVVARTVVAIRERVEMASVAGGVYV